MYRVVREVDTQIEEVERLHPDPGIHRARLRARDFVPEYATKHNMSQTEVGHLLDSCIAADYLTADGGSLLQIDATKGRHLLDNL